METGKSRVELDARDACISLIYRSIRGKKDPRAKFVSQGLLLPAFPFPLLCGLRPSSMPSFLMPHPPSSAPPWLAGPPGFGTNNARSPCDAPRCPPVTTEPQHSFLSLLSLSWLRTGSITLPSGCPARVGTLALKPFSLPFSFLQSCCPLLPYGILQVYNHHVLSPSQWLPAVRVLEDGSQVRPLGLCLL